MKALPGPRPGDPLEVVVLHPPGGLAGGDDVAVGLDLGPGCRVLATTPGAQKWYRKGGVGAGKTPATARSRLTVGDGAVLEWLPQPAILYDRADARQLLEIELAGNGLCIGWEILVRGRAAMGERFACGRIDQTVSIRVDGVSWWQDRLLADADDRLFDSPVGWRGRTVAATVWAGGAGAGAAMTDLLAQWRQPTEAGSLLIGVSRVTPDLMLARLLGNDSEAVFEACRALWRSARNSLLGREGDSPRIWTT